MSAVQVLAQSVLDTLAPRPCEGHRLIRSTDMPDGGRLHTCSCGVQTRTAVPSATDAEKLALIVIEQDRTLRELQGQVAKSREVCEWVSEGAADGYPTDYAPMVCLTESMWHVPKFCPSCGRKASIKESLND